MYRSTRRSPVPVIEPRDVVPMPDRRGMLSSLEAVRREIREIGDEYLDAVLQLITESALNLTGASGAALAFLTDDKMICRARAGEPAPPLGAPVDVQQGLSGECVRTGLLVWCQDMENDGRIDPEIGRRMGIGSLIAVPIVSNFRVVGLLEVFSPHLRGFTKDHEAVLDRLVEMVPRTLCETAELENTQSETTQPETPVRPEAGSQPPSLELESIEAGSSELVSIQVTREDLREQKPEVPEPVSAQVSEILGRNVSEPVPDQLPELAPAGPSSWLRWVLLNWAVLGLVSAGVSMALGYLVGFVIEAR
jgi:putative methionine-R-sulfoxide reductase with GAF domain